MLHAMLLSVLNNEVFKSQNMYNLSRRTIVDCQRNHVHSVILKYANLTCSFTNKYSMYYTWGTLHIILLTIFSNSVCFATFVLNPLCNQLSYIC